MDTIRHSLVLWSWVYSLMTIFLDLPSQNHEYIPRCLFSQYYLLKIMNIISHDYFLDVAFSRSWTYSPKTSLYCLVKIKNCIPPWLYYQKLPWRWTPSVTPPTSSSTSGSLPGEPIIGRSLYKVKKQTILFPSLGRGFSGLQKSNPQCRDSSPTMIFPRSLNLFCYNHNFSIYIFLILYIDVFDF